MALRDEPPSISIPRARFRKMRNLLFQNLNAKLFGGASQAAFLLDFPIFEGSIRWGRRYDVARALCGGEARCHEVDIKIGRDGSTR